VVKSGSRKMPSNARLNVPAIGLEKQFLSRSPTSPVNVKEIGPSRVNQSIAFLFFSFLV
jgi:hypothetical protein